MRPLERVFHIAAMITQFGGILPIYVTLTGADIQVGDSAPINSAMMVLILMVSSVLAVRYRANIIRAIPAMLPVLCFLLLAILSALWSDYPGISVRRAGTAITTAMWGAYLASRFSLRDIIVMIGQSIFIIAVASLFAGLVVPEIGLDVVSEGNFDNVPGWRGILDGKNTLGIVMATGTTTMLYLVLSPGESRGRKAGWLIGVLLCAVLLYLSQSRTSWIAGVVGVGACFTSRLIYRRPGFGLVALCSLLLLGGPALLLVVNDLGSLTSLIGKDATLTGRVDLWHEVLPYGDRRPWLGYGYGAFWIEDSPLTQEIWRNLNSYKPPHAHNGWIETYLELGIIGCAVVAVQMLQMLINAARATYGGRDVDAPYMLLVIAMMLIFNMVEADLIRAPALFWPFLIIGPVALSKVLNRPDGVGLRNERHRSRFAPNEIGRARVTPAIGPRRTSAWR
jgi:exopolysaccharide production protein ExoQ